ncbi:hypothetical protein QJQ45_028886, partial [Haematococcus lacustris]
MQQHATRDTSIPNLAAATSTAPKCAASQPAMKCGSVPRRSGTFQQPEAATTTATSSGSQGGGQEQKRTLLPPRSSLLPPPSSLFPPPSFLLPPPYHTAHHHLPGPPLPLSLPLRNDQGTAWSKQTQDRSAHPHPHPWWHHLPDLPLTRRRNQEEQPRGAARSGSQEQQLGAAARSGCQEAWARQVVGQGQEAHAPHSQEAQPGGRSSSQQGGSKESAMAHGDNSVTVTRPPLANQDF